MNILILNGPNLNLLGQREPQLYGVQDYAALQNYVREASEELGCTVEMRQSNHEGVLVDWIQQARPRFDGLVINAAAYTHTSVALLEAVEVHLTNVDAREPFRRVSYVGMACRARFVGLGFEGYKRAMAYLIETFSGENG